MDYASRRVPEARHRLQGHAKTYVETLEAYTTYMVSICPGSVNMRRQTHTSKKIFFDQIKEGFDHICHTKPERWKIVTNFIPRINKQLLTIE